MEWMRMWVLAWVVSGCCVGAKAWVPCGLWVVEGCGVWSTDEHPPAVCLPACLVHRR